MQKFVTIISFTYSFQAYILKGKLESEGIICFIKDELAVQSNPIYSNALGGIKLQVMEQDYFRSLEVMKEAGYIINRNENMPAFIEVLAQKTASIPLFNRIPGLYRALFILIIIILAGLIGYMILTEKI